MANTTVERGRCFHEVVYDPVCGLGSDLFLVRSAMPATMPTRQVLL